MSFNDQFQDLIFAPEAAQILGCSADQICNLARKGKLPVAGRQRGTNGKMVRVFRREVIVRLRDARERGEGSL